jgi:LacI family transcriptional regulator
MNSKAQPYVLIDRDLDGVDANFVGINDKRAGYLATEHLVSMGCRRIAHIRGQDNSPGNGRFQGYKDALLDNNLHFSDDYVVRRSYVDIETTRQGAEAMRLLLELDPKPDGVFCFNDPLAIGAMSTILEAGLRIPEDIALIGCGNLPNNDWLRVPLSSIDQRSQTVGRRAAELALNLIESKHMPRTQTTVLEPTLVIRSSTRKREIK